MEAFIHPLPPSGYSALSQGESWLQTETITAPATVPLQGDEERSDGGGG